MPLFGENETKSSVDGEKCRWQWLEHFFCENKEIKSFDGGIAGKSYFLGICSHKITIKAYL
jgi:hypothetical protein